MQVLSLVTYSTLVIQYLGKMILESVTVSNDFGCWDHVLSYHSKSIRKIENSNIFFLVSL